MEAAPAVVWSESAGAVKTKLGGWGTAGFRCRMMSCPAAAVMKRHKLDAK